MRCSSLFAILFFITFAGCIKQNDDIDDQDHHTLVQGRKDTLKSIPQMPGIEIYDGSKWRKQRSQLEQFFNKAWKRNNVSGGLIVAKDDQILFEDYTGLAVREDSTVMDSDTPLHLASLSKVITGTSVLRLIDQGKIKLDDYVDDYLSNFPYDSITIRDLLTHRSGLPNYLYFTDKDDIWNKMKVLSNNDVLNLLANNSIDAAFSPNTRFSYNNTNYVLLALIIEQVTNSSFQKAMADLIFNPLGMTNSFVADYAGPTDNLTPSYKSSGRLWVTNFQDGTSGDKNIYSTPRDLLKLDASLYASEFLSDEMRKLAYQGYSYERPGVNNYGLGMRLKEFDDGRKILYHNGWWHGSNTCYLRDEKNHITIIALGNKYTRLIYSAFGLINLFDDYPISTDPIIDKLIDESK